MNFKCNINSFLYTVFIQIEATQNIREFSSILFHKHAVFICVSEKNSNKLEETIKGTGSRFYLDKYGTCARKLVAYIFLLAKIKNQNSK
jgi:hypothetical protein